MKSKLLICSAAAIGVLLNGVVNVDYAYSAATPTEAVAPDIMGEAANNSGAEKFQLMLKHDTIEILNRTFNLEEAVQARNEEEIKVRVSEIKAQIDARSLYLRQILDFLQKFKSETEPFFKRFEEAMSADGMTDIQNSSMSRGSFDRYVRSGNRTYFYNNCYADLNSGWCYWNNQWVPLPQEDLKSSVKWNGKSWELLPGNTKFSVGYRDYVRFFDQSDKGKLIDDFRRAVWRYFSVSQENITKIDISIPLINTGDGTEGKSIPACFGYLQLPFELLSKFLVVCPGCCDSLCRYIDLLIKLCNQALNNPFGTPSQSTQNIFNDIANAVDQQMRTGNSSRIRPHTINIAANITALNNTMEELSGNENRYRFNSADIKLLLLFSQVIVGEYDVKNNTQYFNLRGALNRQQSSGAPLLPEIITTVEGAVQNPSCRQLIIAFARYIANINNSNTPRETEATENTQVATAVAVTSDEQSFRLYEENISALRAFAENDIDQDEGGIVKKRRLKSDFAAGLNKLNKTQGWVALPDVVKVISDSFKNNENRINLLVEKAKELAEEPAASSSAKAEKKDLASSSSSAESSTATPPPLSGAAHMKAPDLSQLPPPPPPSAAYTGVPSLSQLPPPPPPPSAAYTGGPDLSQLPPPPPPPLSRN